MIENTPADPSSPISKGLGISAPTVTSADVISVTAPATPAPAALVIPMEESAAAAAPITPALPKSPSTPRDISKQAVATPRDVIKTPSAPLSAVKQLELRAAELNAREADLIERETAVQVNESNLSITHKHALACSCTRSQRAHSE